MTRLGFAIDQRSCIGCHACTVACKTEHEIPLGQFRTWVKYVDRGTYPHSSRAFGVMRCNHCTNAPCVTICPTKALFKRDDGIVDFDRDRCIACKSCLQACPYDAIYIDADTHTAAKCNFCAHRVDQGLEPSCVVVCPTHSIWVGDLDDPLSRISKLIATNETSVRAPQQNTQPNVFYLGADEAVLDPLLAPPDASYISARPDRLRAVVGHDLLVDPNSLARTTANTAHPHSWGWQVSAYMWTKSVGAGVLLIASVASFASVDLRTLDSLVAPSAAIVATALTGVLLTADLDRPQRVLYLFTKSNRQSWLFRGSLALLAFGAVATGWLAVGVGQATGRIQTGSASAALRTLRLLAAPSAALTAGYTAFLFGQAEGRDLWQSRTLLPHLLAQAALAGSGALLTAAGFLELPAGPRQWLTRAFVGASCANLAVLAVEYGTPHHSANAAAAARLITRGRYAKRFRWGALGLTALGAVVAAPALGGRHRRFAATAGIAAQAALIAYESIFIAAGQDVPLS